MKMTPHIVLVPFPAQGHLPPMIHLARKLAAQGFIVSLINFGSIHENLSQRWECLPGQDIRLLKVHFELEIPAGMVAASLNDRASFTECFERVEARLEQLISTIKPAPCCVVFDYFLTWVVSILQRLNLKAVCYWPGNALWAVVQHHLNLLFQYGDAVEESIPVEKQYKIIDYIPGVESLQLRDYPAYLFNKHTDFVLRHLVASCDRMNYCDWILANTMEELEPETLQVMQQVLNNRNFVAVGPLFPLSGKRTAEGSLREQSRDLILKWLDAREAKSVMYISFGSISVLSVDSFKDLGDAVEASGSSFLMVVPRDWVEDELVEPFRKRTQEQGLVVRWAPQVEVLSHPSVGGFLSHCGWNSTFESICHGVPILGWPCHSEQSLNCKMVVDWKMGIRLGRDLSPVGEAGAETMKHFMSGDSDEVREIRSRAAAFQEMARSAARDEGSSGRNLQRFMQEMKAASAAASAATLTVVVTDEGAQATSP